MNESPIVELREVHKAYPLGETVVQALKGVDLKINKGDFTAIVGSSGAGKSTLMNLIGCIDEPDAGQILIEGEAASNRSEPEKCILRNEKIGFIFQSFNLIPVLSVYENVELPLLVQKKMTLEERQKAVDEVLKDVDLLKYRDSLPNKLSGGQRQRVAIARALVNKPGLVLADEPTANLDSQTAHTIIDLLLKLNKDKGTTFLFSTHDEKLIGRVNKVLRIQDGRIQG
ncbi:MAG: ABC transporter ATP-binding protein [Bdellovibrio sp.]